MKIIITFLLLVTYIFSQVERYELVNLSNKKVYFPKANKAYLEELFNTEDKDSLLYLAEFYTEMGEDEIALGYYNSYDGYNKDLREKIAAKLGVEVENIPIKNEVIPEFEKYKDYFNIKNIEDLKAYLKYFSLNLNDFEKNSYEKLIEFKFQKKTEEFNSLITTLFSDAQIRKNEYEFFVLYTLNNQYNEAKDIALQKPNLFIKLIKYMDYYKVDANLIKSFIEEFENKYGQTYFADSLINIELDLTATEEEKQMKREEYLKKAYNEEIFKAYLENKNQNIDFLKEYLKDLVLKKGKENYILKLIELDKSLNEEEVLKGLLDKREYFKYLDKKEIEPEKEYYKEYAEYQYELKNYEKLVKYKEYLPLYMLKTLAINGYNEVIPIIVEKYPLEIEYADLSKIEYFYFNKNFEYDEDLVKELSKKNQLLPAETCYLSRYYEKIGEKEKALDLEYVLKREYNLKLMKSEK